MTRFYRCSGCDRFNIPDDETQEYCDACNTRFALSHNGFPFLGGLEEFLKLIDAGTFFEDVDGCNT